MRPEDGLLCRRRVHGIRGGVDRPAPACGGTPLKGVVLAGGSTTRLDPRGTTGLDTGPEDDPLAAAYAMGRSRYAQYLRYTAKDVEDVSA